MQKVFDGFFEYAIVAFHKVEIHVDIFGYFYVLTFFRHFGFDFFSLRLSLLAMMCSFFGLIYFQVFSLISYDWNGGRLSHMSLVRVQPGEPVFSTVLTFPPPPSSQCT